MSLLNCLFTVSLFLIALSSSTLAKRIHNDSTSTTTYVNLGHVSYPTQSGIIEASKQGFEVIGRSKHSDSPDPLESVSSKSTPTAPSTDPPPPPPIPTTTTTDQKRLYKRAPLYLRWESVINRHSFVNSHLPLVGGQRAAMRVVGDVQRQMTNEGLE